MTKRTLLSACLSLALVLALATTGSAAIWSATTGVGVEYTKKANTWTSESVEVSASAYPSLLFSLDYTAVGSWDGASDPQTKPDTMDSFTVNIFKDGNLVQTYTYNEVDNGGNTIPRATNSIHLEYLLANTPGTYVFQAISNQTAGGTTGVAETWILDGASLTGSTPTPIPAAVWMLGSGLLGIMGFKRSRKNNAA